MPPDEANKPAPSTTDISRWEIIAAVRSYRFFPETGWTIIDLTTGDTATGEFEEGELSAGVTYRFFGTWIIHAKYGPQFAVDSFVLAPQQNEAGVVGYLSRTGTGLTRTDAAKLWRTYGPDAVQRLRADPAAVALECNLNAVRCAGAAAVLDAIARDEPATIELFELFSGRGFPKGVVKACIRKWSTKAPAVVRRDPFKMIVAEIRGVGFKRADSLYLDLGGNPKRLKRAMFAGWHWMRNEGTGNTWERAGRVEKAILETIGPCELLKAIRLGVRAGWFSKRIDADGKEWLAEWENASNERKAALHARRIMTYKPRWALAADDSLSDHQREKLTGILHSPLAILAGTPGTGKTYSAAALIRGLLRQPHRPRILVMAPTGKAAVRITEAMRKYHLPLQATTIHSGLRVMGHSTGKAEFYHGEQQPLDCQVLIVDESSMIDTDIMAALLSAVPEGGNVLLVGDPYQLPPVGHGSPLRDLKAAGIPTALLEEIKRNAGTIVTACKEIKDGHLFDTAQTIDIENGLNLKHLFAPTPEQQAATVISVLSAAATQGFNATWDVQVLVVRNDGEFVGRKALNVALQAYLNPELETDENRRNPKFRKGDKVICLRNTSVIGYDLAPLADPTDMDSYRCGGLRDQVYIANGDMGKVVATGKNAAIVRFSNPDRVVKAHTDRRKSEDTTSGTKDKVDFDLAYAITTHKSQGSEWPVVLFVLDEGAGRIGCRELIYTGISRASKLCMLIGKLPTAFKMIHREELVTRQTYLRQLLTGEGT